MTASDWGPDSPATVARDDADSVPSVAAPGRTPVPEGDRAPEERTDDLRTEIARTLVARFSPHHLDPEYRAERRGVPEPVNDSTMVTFTASDGHLSMRPLTFGEVADALIDVGYRRLVSDDEATVDRVARAMWTADLADFSAESGTTMQASDENWVLASSTGSYQRAARAAVRALREAGTDA